MVMRLSITSARRRASDPMTSGRARVRVIASAVVCAAAVAVSGCGLATSSGGAASSPSAHPAQASVAITVSSGPGTKAVHWTLRCDPPGGTHPDPTDACKALLTAKTPFAPLRARLDCPMILASAKRAVITGTWFGHKVHRVVIDGGCDLGLWDALGKVFN